MLDDEGLSAPVTSGGPRARRRWPVAEKRRIVLESFEAGASVSVVARRHDVNAKARGWFRWIVADGPGGGCGRGRLGALPRSHRAGGSMIPVRGDVRVWLASGVTDMRRGMNTLALQVQEALGRDPHAGDLFVFRGRRGDLLKILWHDGVGMSLYAKRLEHGRFVWPSAQAGSVAISSAQLAYMLDGIDWRHPRMTWRPRSAG